MSDEGSGTIFIRIDPGWSPGEGEVSVSPDYEDELTAVFKELGVPTSPVLKHSQASEALATFAVFGPIGLALWKTLPAVLEKFWHRHDGKTITVEVAGQTKVSTAGLSPRQSVGIFDKIPEVAAQAQQRREQQWKDVRSEDLTDALRTRGLADEIAVVEIAHSLVNDGRAIAEAIDSAQAAVRGPAPLDPPPPGSGNSASR